MDEDIGSKVKALAIINCVIDIIAAIIGGIIVWFNSHDHGFLYFLLIAVSGSIIAWISALVLYAIGEAADNTQTNRKLDQILQILQNSDAKPNPYSSISASISQVTNGQQAVPSVPQKQRDPDTGSMKQICPECGEKNDIARVFCHKCGARLS